MISQCDRGGGSYTHTLHIETKVPVFVEARVVVSYAAELAFWQSIDEVVERSVGFAHGGR